MFCFLLDSSQIWYVYGWVPRFGPYILYSAWSSGIVFMFEALVFILLLIDWSLTYSLLFYIYIYFKACQFHKNYTILEPHSSPDHASFWLRRNINAGWQHLPLWEKLHLSFFSFWLSPYTTVMLQLVLFFHVHMHIFNSSKEFCEFPRFDPILLSLKTQWEVQSWDCPFPLKVWLGS